MSILARPAVDSSHALELLELARTIMQRKHDQDLIEKVTVLQGYLELSQMSPDRDYGPILRRALREVTAAVHFHLEGAAHTGKHFDTPSSGFILCADSGDRRLGPVVFSPRT